MLKVLAKTAVFSALMMGNITSPSDDNYYVEDGDFNYINETISNGWGWGFNRAHAACGDASAPPDCYTSGPGDDFGYEPPYSGGGGYGGDYGDYGDNGDYDAGGYGGGPSPTPIYTEYEECLRNAVLLNNGCVRVRTQQIITEHNYCIAIWSFEDFPGGGNALAGSAAKAACDLVMEDHLNGVQALCLADFEKELNKCK